MLGLPTIVVTSEDPRASHHANEAMRIALGVVAARDLLVHSHCGGTLKIIASLFP